MGENTRKIDTRITTRYDYKHQDIFREVLKLVEQNNIPKSTAQLLLVERGLAHTNNPEPLIKEVEKKVYVDRLVYIKSDQTNVKGQRASDDKLTNPNKAKSGPPSSKVALEEKKSSNDKTGVTGWIAIIALFVGLPLIGYFCDKHSNQISEWWTKMYRL